MRGLHVGQPVFSPETDVRCSSNATPKGCGLRAGAPAAWGRMTIAPPAPGAPQGHGRKTAPSDRVVSTATGQGPGEGRDNPVTTPSPRRRRTGLSCRRSGPRRAHRRDEHHVPARRATESTRSGRGHRPGTTPQGVAFITPLAQSTPQCAQDPIPGPQLARNRQLVALLDRQTRRPPCPPVRTTAGGERSGKLREYLECKVRREPRGRPQTPVPRSATMATVGPPGRRAVSAARRFAMAGWQKSVAQSESL